MKKIFLMLIVSIFSLQSCSLNSEITYHKDAASTTMMDVDMKDAMSMMKSMMPDSLQNDKKGLGELDKLPKTWTSLYEMEKRDGKLKTENPDSIRIMKKVFIKSNIQNNEISGVSLKIDHFTKADYTALSNFSKQEKLPFEQMALNAWDGKTLTIETDKLNLSSLKDVMSGKQFGGEEFSDGDTEKTMGMLKMMFKKIGTTLKFENKIKSITGKHDWITKVDDYSVRVDYDIDAMFGDVKKPLKNSDKKIIIVTE